MKHFLVLTLLTVTLAAPTRGEDVIVNAKKLYTIAGDVMEPGSVFISDGKIKAIGNKLSADGAKTIEVDVLMPGLVDAYSQAGLEQSAERTREITPDLTTAGKINYRDRDFVEAISSGTTTLHIVPGTDNVFAGIGSGVKTAGKDRVFNPSTGLMMTSCADPARFNRSRSRPESIYVRQPTNRMGVVWILRSTLDAAAKGSDNKGMDVLRSAMKGERPAFAVSRTHYDTLSLMDICREFKMEVPVIFGGQESWRILDDLKEAKTSVVLGRLRPDSTNGSEQTRLCANNAGRLHEAGIPFCFSQGDLLEQARFAVRNGLNEDAALKAITHMPAKILGLEKKVGAIAEGLDADLVALSGDPLEFTTAVEWVMVDGIVQYKQAGE
ncbi:MAG: amidohydrolase family protein [Planctomycetaceae bacterium]